ncbi:hypothetical protein ES319_A04G037700v1 [Gossypium barbadense]|uniref:Uncharacterized protein n=2 Tax=Gossypium TaxID=3633 RepID=A0A5J5W212_GOSBA|nr:hypothetical protein ES319_A04G037700v1 [Gossypium barbadense]TYH21446.1 hypothetical protein ES288_A04G045100v1 [Gossypium darwinii]
MYFEARCACMWQQLGALISSLNFIQPNLAMKSTDPLT